jgi:hypothetical protein
MSAVWEMIHTRKHQRAPTSAQFDPQHRTPHPVTASSDDSSHFLPTLIPARPNGGPISHATASSTSYNIVCDEHLDG